MSDQMEISMIRPSLNGTPLSDAMQPLAFAILSSLTPPDMKVSLLDERVEDIAYDHPTDLVALTVETYTARRAYQIAARFRERGVPVIMGGYHPTLAPKEALQYADSVAIGDAEGLWERIVRDAQAGRLEQIYRQQNQLPLRGLKPDRRIFQGKRYAPMLPVQYGRGCQFACDFCSIHAFYGSHLRQRPVHEVVAEIEELDRKYIFVVDDNVFVDMPKAKKLFQALVPLNVRWACQADIGITQNTELLDLMAQSGCIAVIVGFESLNSNNLKQMKKRQNPGDYAAAIQKLQDHGIMIYGTFVFGYDSDTVESLDATVEFALRHKFCLANFNPLTPIPGTRLYDRLRAQDRLIYDRWWLDPDYRYGQAIFHPKGMTADQLTEGCYRARRQFNRYSSIFQRALCLRANCQSIHHLAGFVVSNLISRKEIHGKQGQRLGSSAPLPSVRETL